MIYFGFDLGDGESCITWSRNLETSEPMPISINGDLSFKSAVAILNGQPVIGRLAAAGNDALDELRVCFKRHFLENRADINRAVKNFVAGILAAMEQNEELRKNLAKPDEVCFVVGCPAGWKEEDRNRYRQLLTEAGLPNVRLASESRAAFENALRRKVEGVDPELIEDCVLVVDIGSSTLDMAYVCDGQEHNVEILGDVKLGGGLMDEMIVHYALSKLGNQEAATRMRRYLESHPTWYSRVMLEARAIKERYFLKEDLYFSSNETIQKFVRIPGVPGVQGLTLELSPEIVEGYIISQPHPLLDGQSFESRLRNALNKVHTQIRTSSRREPKIVILTGGPSRMRFFQELCTDEFSDSRVIISKEPEYDIARGLAYAGCVDEGYVSLLAEMRAYIEGNAVENHVRSAMPELIATIAANLSSNIMTNCVARTFNSWRNGTLDTLEDFEEATGRVIAAYMQSNTGKALIESACTPWARSIMVKVQKDLDQIARKHSVSLGQIRSGTIQVSTDGNGLDGLDVTAQLTVMVQTIITIVTAIVAGVLCGGGGTALITAGPLGWIVGAVIAGYAAFRGREIVKEAVMTLSIPGLVRKLIPAALISNEANLEKTRQAIYDGLMADRALTGDIALQVCTLIDSNLADMIKDNEVQIVS